MEVHKNCSSSNGNFEPANRALVGFRVSDTWLWTTRVGKALNALLGKQKLGRSSKIMKILKLKSARTLPRKLPAAVFEEKRWKNRGNKKRKIDLTGSCDWLSQNVRLVSSVCYSWQIARLISLITQKADCQSISLNAGRRRLAVFFKLEQLCQKQRWRSIFLESRRLRHLTARTFVPLEKTRAWERGTVGVAEK